MTSAVKDRKQSQLKEYMMINLDTIGLLDPKAQVTPFNPGDIVRVHVKIKEGDKERIQVFQGTVIQKRGVGAGASFTVRKLSEHGVFVERIFPTYSPNVAKVELVKQGKVRRAKLFYMRELTGRAARVKEKKTDMVEAGAE
jgi:large subunit ribosomal protein L19